MIKCARVEETDVSGVKILKIFEYVDDQQPELSIKLEEVASIIDGQHRLKGLEEAKKIILKYLPQYSLGRMTQLTQCFFQSSIWHRQKSIEA